MSVQNINTTSKGRGTSLNAHICVFFGVRVHEGGYFSRVIRVSLLISKKPKLAGIQ